MIQVYTFFNGIPRVVGSIPELNNGAEWKQLKELYPNKELYQGPIVERHQALGYVEETARG